MKYPRFRVATCEGYPISGNLVSRQGGPATPGLSATVCDTYNLWRAVKTYRSEDRVFRNGRFTHRGREGAETDAADHAAHLNAMHRRALHAERVKEGRKAARERG